MTRSQNCIPRGCSFLFRVGVTRGGSGTVSSTVSNSVTPIAQLRDIYVVMIPSALGGLLSKSFPLCLFLLRFFHRIRGFS